MLFIDLLYIVAFHENELQAIIDANCNPFLRSLGNLEKNLANGFWHWSCVRQGLTDCEKKMQPLDEKIQRSNALSY